MYLTLSSGEVKNEGIVFAQCHIYVTYNKNIVEQIDTVPKLYQSIIGINLYLMCNDTYIYVIYLYYQKEIECHESKHNTFYNVLKKLENIKMLIAKSQGQEHYHDIQFMYTLYVIPNEMFGRCECAGCYEFD